MRVLVIEDVAERHDQAVRRARVGNAVDALAQRDEPHVQQRKRVLKVLADLDVVASQSGQILDDHAVDDAGAQVVHHASEIRPVEVGAGIAVINVQPGRGHVGLRICKLGQQFALTDDAVALLAVAVLAGKTDIKRGFPQDCG